MATITMDFWRDDYTGPACLEYSYVPEGKRRTIQLRPGQQEAIQDDTVPDDLKPSHVQVYTLTNNDAVSLGMWQFPPGPPYVLPVIGAQVSVFMAHSSLLDVLRPLDHVLATARSCDLRMLAIRDRKKAVSL